MSRIILEIESLYKTYGEKENAAEALRGISFQVYQGVHRSNQGKNVCN